MEKRIALEKRGRPEEEIKELNLDNCKSTNIEGLTDKFTNLQHLSLINAGLVSLKNFPKLKNLKRLELSDNRLSNGLQHLSSLVSLVSLNLSGNRIKDIEEIRPLAELPKLEVLDLFNNDITQSENYRQRMFEILGKTLKYLDGFDANEVEAPSDDGNGDSDDEYEGEDSDENDCSLAEVYNDDLEDDNDSWGGDNEEVEEEEDEDLDEDGAEGEDTPNNLSTENVGKKRKLDED